jgi:hypothetical protein
MGATSRYKLRGQQGRLRLSDKPPSNSVLLTDPAQRAQIIRHPGSYLDIPRASGSYRLRRARQGLMPSPFCFGGEERWPVGTPPPC